MMGSWGGILGAAFLLGPIAIGRKESQLMGQMMAAMLRVRLTD